MMITTLQGAKVKKMVVCKPQSNNRRSTGRLDNKSKGYFSVLQLTIMLYCFRVLIGVGVFT